MQFYGITFMHPYKQSGRWQDIFDQYEYQTLLPSIYQTAYTYEWKNTINRHVQVFLRMNTWMFETC